MGKKINKTDIYLDLSRKWLKLIKSAGIFFYNNLQADLKISMEIQETRNSKAILKKNKDHKGML